MNYMITVTKNGKHYFATQKMNKKATNIGLMYRSFQKKFPVQEGFAINVYKMTICSSLLICFTYIGFSVQKYNFSKVQILIPFPFLFGNC